MMKKNHQSTQIDNSRRQFLKRSILGSGAFFLSSLSPLKIFSENSSLNSLFSPISEEEAAILSKQAKEYFYLKEYGKASQIYDQLISAFPENIKYYHHYGKVFGAQQKLLERAELFRIGLQKNPTNPDFMHHLGLNIRTICKGSSKAMDEFKLKYGINELYNYAAELLINAIEINPSNTNYYLDLKDFQLAYVPSSTHVNTLNLSAGLDDKINSLCSPYEDKWKATRKSRKPEFKEESLLRSFSTISPKRAYSVGELAAIQKNMTKGKLRTLYIPFLRSVTPGSYNAKDAKNYGMKILAIDINQTAVVGKLRKFYRHNKDYDSLKEMYKYLYANNPSINNTLSLAVNLTKYGSFTEQITEVKKLLDTITNVEYLPSIYASMYYYSLARYKFRNQISTSVGYVNPGRQVLLDGLKQFDGAGGCALALMIQYALSHSSSLERIAHGRNILKALGGSSFTVNADPIWDYVKKYQQFVKENPLSDAEAAKITAAINKLNGSIVVTPMPS